MKTFRHKTAVITGAAGGLGFALAAELARVGCHLELVDNDQARLAEATSRLPPGTNVRTHVVDITLCGGLESLVDDIMRTRSPDGVHLLVNAAGLGAIGSVEKTPPDLFDRMWQVNVLGTVRLCRLFLPHLRRADQAHIVNIGSVLGLIGMSELSAYTTSKFAVHGFTQSLWAELCGSGVGVTLVVPGALRTGITERMSLAPDASVDRGEIADYFSRQGRSPEWAARLIVDAMRRRRRVLHLCKETYAIAWLLRLWPDATHWLLARARRRAPH